MPQWENGAGLFNLPRSPISHLVRPPKHLNLILTNIVEYSLSFVHLYLHRVHKPLYTSLSFAYRAYISNT